MKNWFDYFKDRRFAPVFFVTLVLLFTVTGLQVGLRIDLLQYWPYLVVPLAGWTVAVVWRFMVVVRARRRDRYQVSPMSREEVRKARSKLNGGRNPANRPANRPIPRPPDTYLKY